MFKTILSLTSLALAAASAHGAILNLDLKGAGGWGLLPTNEVPATTGGTGGEIGDGIFYDTDTQILTLNFGWGSDYGFTDLSSEINNDVGGGLHIHGPATMEENAGIKVYLEEDGVSDNGSFVRNDGLSGSFYGTVVLDDNKEEDLLAGLYYINLHTLDNASGEIRGNIVNPAMIPEPGTYAALAGIGALGLVGFLRRRRRA